MALNEGRPGLPNGNASQLHGERLKKKPQAVKFDSVALFLQGGGALAAYEVGVLDALDAVGLAPKRLGGFSMGAINAAVYAGNPAATRSGKLHAFWDSITTDQPVNHFGTLDANFQWFADMFVPKNHKAVPFINPSTLLGATHWPKEIHGIGKLSATLDYQYDPVQLGQKIAGNEYIDYEHLNTGMAPHLSVGAVDKKSGETVYFSNRGQEITPDHIMASGAVPRLFPEVVIDGKPYFDGGFGKQDHNDPIHEILTDRGMKSVKSGTLVIQADVWPIKPDGKADSFERAEDAQFGPQRIVLPQNFTGTVAHIVAPHFNNDTAHKASDFSKATVSRRMDEGYLDTIAMLCRPEIFPRLPGKARALVSAASHKVPELAERLERGRMQTEELVQPPVPPAASPRR